MTDHRRRPLSAADRPLTITPTGSTGYAGTRTVDRPTYPAGDRTPVGHPDRRGTGTGGGGHPRARKTLRILAIVLLVGTLAVLAAAALAYAMVDIPNVNEAAKNQTSTVYYAGGRAELGRFGDTNRVAVPLDRVPRHVRDAVLAAENREFYSDNGVSPRGIARAFWVNLRGGATQGGSTITQQYVKNAYLTQERTLSRKLREAILAIKLDKELSKNQILENYLNTIYFGRGASGVQTASKAYFNRNVERLTVAQGAALAAIIRSPGYYDPGENPEALKRRWTYVLDGMVQMGALTPQEATAQRFPRFAEPKKEPRYGGQRGYLLSAVRAELEARGLTAEQIENGGLRIVTTLDEKAQKAAVAAVEKEFPSAAKGVRVGLAAVQPGTGKVIAMYGGKDYLGDDKYAQVNAATAKLQPGSTFKAFTLAAALEEEIGLADRFAGNSPLDVPGSPAVENQGNRDWGESITLLTATKESVNTAFVHLSMKVGSRKVADAAVRAGIPAEQLEGNINARLTLGIAPVSPLQMAGSYATFAAEGVRAQPHLVERVLGPNGGVVPIETLKPKRVFAEEVTRDVSYALRGVVKDGGTGQRARALGRPAAAKTGTHEGPKGIQTAWFVGYTPQLSAAVMFYRGDGTESLKGVGGFDVFTGGRYPAMLWTAFMRGALQGMPVEQFPPPAWIGGPPPPPPAPAPPPVRTPEKQVTVTPTPTAERTVRPWPRFTRPNRSPCFPFCSEPTMSSTPREPSPTKTRSWRSRTPPPPPQQTFR
jgi:membrane peptidoglycan carboxypeptidase